VQRGIRQPDEVDAGQAAADIGLDLDQVPGHAVERDRPRAREPHQKAAS
jgi:hypothetical protein